MGSTTHTITLPNGTEILYSYATPVAATLADGTKIRSLVRYSVTTSKHVAEHGYANATKVPQQVIDDLLAPPPPDLAAVPAELLAAEVRRRLGSLS